MKCHFYLELTRNNLMISIDTYSNEKNRETRMGLFFSWRILFLKEKSYLGKVVDKRVTWALTQAMRVGRKWIKVESPSLMFKNMKPWQESK